MAYKYTIKKTYHYYGYPEAEYRYEVKGQFFTANVRYYGNHGFDIPQVNCSSRNNGYFWTLNTFMRALYQDKLRAYFLNLKEGESVTFELEHYQY
jgi:hypothetical protein